MFRSRVAETGPSATGPGLHVGLKAVADRCRHHWTLNFGARCISTVGSQAPSVSHGCPSARVSPENPETQGHRCQLMEKLESGQVVDWKAASWSEDRKVWTQRGPQHLNYWALADAGLLNSGCIFYRTQPPSAISHNKFIVLSKPDGQAVAVWMRRTRGAMVILLTSEERKSRGGAWMPEKLTGLNEHVRYVHTKILLIDFFTDDPIALSSVQKQRWGAELVKKIKWNH
eukprot:Skav204363  [mRNA]  locus=scaffold866:59527:65603:+ [translate_table: standard]